MGHALRKKKPKTTTNDMYLAVCKKTLPRLVHLNNRKMIESLVYNFTVA